MIVETFVFADRLLLRSQRRMGASVAVTDIPTEPPHDLVRALFSTSHVPLVLFDHDLRVVFATRSFCSAFGIDPQETDGRVLAEIGAGEWDMPQLRDMLENAISADPDTDDQETDLLRTGLDARRLIVNARSLLYDRELPAGVLLSINDVTNARTVEELNVTLLLEKDDLLREREVLLQEMQHRVANSLQIIASILLLKARAVTSEESRVHLRDAHDRVMSVAAVQQHLQSNIGDVDLPYYLAKLCGSLASSMISESRPLTLEVESDAAIVSSHEAVSLGLVVTELVINALKHAFPTARAGKIVVSYRLDGDGWALSVADDGVGVQATPEASATGGLGTSIVNSLARQLHAEVLISDTAPGTRVAITRTPSLS